ncbi:cytochrome b/b6 domain-containing protein [Marinobacterium jannaschii]|uniref:cytochrome b/b6 domain-containing protein n=1 Tax=Marinobacterium jannaschii TaxID=64970 RepID=UPI0004814DDF|nr:cytochrome b/b6 domain-containing protein [Marinobacterium jannaschii]
MNNTPTPGGNKWDLFIRFFHWSVALAFVLNFTLFEEGKRLHEWAGYWILGMLTLRLLWGFIGSKNARFINFVPTAASFKASLQELLNHGRHTPSEGHNPVGGAMVIALMLSLLLTALSGWACQAEILPAEELLEGIHEFFANATLALVSLHVTAVVLLSRLGPENLIRQMVRGR